MRQIDWDQIDYNQTYATREICRHLGVTERQLAHWVDKGFISPLVDADGHGSRRQYTTDNLCDIAIVQALWKKVNNNTIKEVLQWLQMDRIGREIMEGRDYMEPYNDLIVIHGETVEAISYRNVLPDILIEDIISLHADPDVARVRSNYINTVKNNEMVVLLNVRMVYKKLEGLIK